MDIHNLDRYMRTDGRSGEGAITWHSPLEPPFRISGFAWLRNGSGYRRLPHLPEGAVREPVDKLADCTSGGQICFRTDSQRVEVRVALKAPALMYHMPATGQCGFDSYVGETGSKSYGGTVKFDPRLKEYESTVLELDSELSQIRTITLNFPLYQGVDDISVGLEAGAKVLPPPPFHSEKRVVLYGTSITQGASASRPGMAYPNILSRSINLEFINLGFSGNGRGEPELAELVSQVDNPACLLLDYEANCLSTAYYRQTLPDFIRIYRSFHPEVPIVLMSKIAIRFEFQKRAEQAEREERLRFQQELVASLRSQGELKLTFVDGTSLIGERDHECTVDGVHPNDLGFMTMADRLLPVLKAVLQS
ncbi:hypothetical protein D3C73_474270 [compost metagenome]